MKDLISRMTRGYVNRRGMYIVEAAIVLPVFIVSMVMVISVIPVISTCENIVFSAADELRLDSARAAFTDKVTAYPIALYTRVNSENRGISSFSVDSYRTGVSGNGIDDLIKTSFSARFRRGISLIAVNGIKFTGNLTCRAFTGTVHTVGDEVDDTIVYIYPEDGEKYHKKGCRYLEAHCHQTVLTQEIMARYRACPLCDAGKAHVGQTVFLFERAGEVYHMPECRQVEKEKYYTETTRSSAERSGYTACSVCGG